MERQVSPLDRPILSLKGPIDLITPAVQWPRITERNGVVELPVHATMTLRMRKNIPLRPRRRVGSRHTFHPRSRPLWTLRSLLYRSRCMRNTLRSTRGRRTENCLKIHQRRSDSTLTVRVPVKEVSHLRRWEESLVVFLSLMEKKIRSRVPIRHRLQEKQRSPKTTTMTSFQMQIRVVLRWLDPLILILEQISYRNQSRPRIILLLQKPLSK
jgi:hypothetical protein